MNIRELVKNISAIPSKMTSLNIYPTDYCNRRCVFCKLTGVLTDQKYRDDMTLEDIDKIISFCKRSGVKQIRILGGEPSQHPQLIDLIERVFERGLYVGIIFTNGLFDNDNLIKCILRHNISVNINYFPLHEYKKGQLELVHENMKRVSLKNKTAAGMARHKQKSGKFFCSITFYRLDQEYQYIIDACLKYGADAIRWAVSHSSLTQENKHITYNMLKGIVPLVMNFVRDVIRAGIDVDVECGLTPCIFTKQEFQFLSRTVGNFQFRCNPILDVFPDLSVHYCMGMPIVSWITENNTLSQIFVEHAIISEYFRERPRSRDCLKCKFWKNKICQGYCLQYKYDRDNSVDRKLLTGIDWMEKRKLKFKS